MARPAATTSVLILAVLTFHLATATLGKKDFCDCCRLDHEVSCCCNCVACVAGRDGLYSFCSFDMGKPERKSDTEPSLKLLRCTCGSQDTFTSPKNSLLFLPRPALASLTIVPLGNVEIAEIPLRLDDVLLTRGHPG